MAIHYFHCTDGVDLVLDRAGRDTVGASALGPEAASVADDLMRELPGYEDWERWAVHIYDASGEVEIVPFTEARARRRAAQASAPRKDVKRSRGRVGRSSH